MHSYDGLIEFITTKRDNSILDNKKLDNSYIHFLEDFFSRYSFEKVSSLADLKPSELLLTILLYEEKDTPFLELKTSVDLVSGLINNLDEKEIEVIQKMADKVEIKDLRELLTDIYQTDNFIQNVTIRRRISKLLGIKGIDYKTIDSESIPETLELVEILKRIKDESFRDLLLFMCHLHHRIQLTRRRFNGATSEENLEKCIKMTLNQMINQQTVVSYSKPLYQYYLSLEKSYSSLQRDNNKKIYSYTELLAILEKEHHKEEIRNIDIILEKAIEEDVQAACLKYIYSHNEKYYQSLEKEYAYKNENSIGKFIDCFNGIGISFTELSEETRKEIMQKSLEEIQKMIKLLSKLSFPNSKVVLIYAKSNFLVVQKLNDLLAKRYIDLEFLQGNVTLYYDEKELENLDKNIEASLKEKINLSKIVDKSFLTTPNILVMENIKLLKVRGINLAQFTELKVLKEDKLEERINRLIEVGLEDAILKDPNILNSDNNLAKRVLIARMIGEEVMENNTLLPLVLDKNLFFVPDSKIDKYLIDRENSNYHSNYEIEFSEGERENSKLSYDIEGIKIPKARVTNLSISLETIIRPSLYNREEIKILEKRAK